MVAQAIEFKQITSWGGDVPMIDISVRSGIFENSYDWYFCRVKLRICR